MNFKDFIKIIEFDEAFLLNYFLEKNLIFFGIELLVNKNLFYM
jgi:hypothetical protein